MDFRRMRASGAWLLACVFVAAGSFPFLSAELAARKNASRSRRLEAASDAERATWPEANQALSLRVSRLGGLLASWETIGGCGAGSSTGAGGGIKWIGHSVTGGLFQLQTLGTYTQLGDGYNLSVSTQVSWDMGEKWNAGLSVPLLYKYYRDYYGLPVDISNAGLGDIAAFLTRRFGEINDTSLTLLVAAPTGVHDAKYKNDYLTQEKQLGIGKFNGSLTLDHTLDKTWGVIVLGGSVGYRGGQNAMGNFRAPVAAAYGYAGYFSGRWTPSLGLALSHFFAVDRDRGLDQEVQLSAVTGTFAMEWANEWLAILGGVSLPLGWDTRGTVDDGRPKKPDARLQPWTAGLGFTISPF